MEENYGQEENEGVEEDEQDEDEVAEPDSQLDEANTAIFDFEEFAEAYETKAKLLKAKDAYKRIQGPLLKKLKGKKNSEFNK